MAKGKATRRDNTRPTEALRQAAETVGDVVGDAVGAVGDAVGAVVSPLADPRTAGTLEALPSTRQELLALHRDARRRRDAAPLLSEERAEAAEELARIEIHIARIERAMTPPLV